MEKDHSRILLDKYLKLTDNNIELDLKDGRRVKGVIAGYYLSDIGMDDSPIHSWHIVDEKDKRNLGFDSFGFMQGEIIRHCDISVIKFQEDNSSMLFY